jgi:D-alanine-D-alanine ligase
MAISLDKGLTKKLAAAAGVRTPPFARVCSPEQASAIDLPFPLFVKPNAEGSNMGVRSSSLVRTREQLDAQVRRILDDHYAACLVEVFAPGRELCVALLGNDPPRFLAPAEVCVADDLYEQPDTPLRHKRMICPVELPPGILEPMQEMTLAVFQALGCRDLGRADFMLDAQGQPTFLEINPLPCLSPATAVFPLQAKAAGLAFEELIGAVIDAALARPH